LTECSGETSWAQASALIAQGLWRSAVHALVVEAWVKVLAK